MPRESYRNISEDKAHILKCSNEGKDFVQRAHTLEINSSTAYDIVQANRKKNNLPKGSTRNKKLDDEFLEVVIESLRENPLFDFKSNDSKKRQIKFVRRPSLERKALSKGLDGPVIILKLARVTSADHKSDQPIDTRFEYGT